MTFAFSDAETFRALEERLAHVRWIVGGTGASKSTLTRLLADRYDVAVYRGDHAERGWLDRCTAQRHPHLAALRNLPPGAMWHDRTPHQVFQAMPSLHGETVGFVVDDLLALSDDRIILVDYFGILPRHLAPLLRQPDQAALLLPTPAFRENALTNRYADPARTRANWGSEDPTDTFTKRLARDALWDEEVRRQAPLHGLDTTVIDGTASASELADRIATRFGLGPGQRASSS
ncbi:hypothetical protein ACWDBO_53165 [Streptomyces mirabilis]|uniref:hypothetical protein n=1 Tax=Streptomyces TaxID=1883 RepID=UPI0029A8532A|nr:hypothetical protein [Streptomyces sp. AK02-04a]MDX3761554.1 hypothetical protein [Streptomyces sp. AK02-04a]